MRDSDGFFKFVSSMTDVMKINHFAPEGFTPVSVPKHYVICL